MSEDIEKLSASFKEFNRKAKANPKMTEEELRTVFKDSKVLKTLGYETVGKDIRIEKSVKGGKRSDIHCLDDYKNVIFVIEFKRPEVTNLKEHFDQLWERYVKPLRARYGALTNGEDLLLYERIDGNSEIILEGEIPSIPAPNWAEIYDYLNKKKVDRTDFNEVLKYFEGFDRPSEKINLTSEEAQTHFFDSFELKEGSVFVDLVEKTLQLFDFAIEGSKFLKSAYGFWKSSYAKEPEKIPDNWKKIMDKAGIEPSKENLFKFMFCLETTYSLFTRIILAKACEDYELPDIDFSEFIKREVRGSAFRGSISALAWPILVNKLIKDMRQKLVKSVFGGDIFYWWADSYEEFEKGEKSIWATRQDREKIHFGEALAEVILTLYKFDFSEIVGDPLGTLYQRYFDKETRKALGEFYTPKEVVDYILDAVEYKGKSVVSKRLLDPACGSGTFLVEALKRYLDGAKDKAQEKGWDEVLKDLCNEYHIVGFDIHPFATFMAQMQFMLVLIPKYKEAILSNRSFVLNRLPIFRTDSLAVETKEEKITLMKFQNGSRYLSVDTMLPINENRGNTLRINMPYRGDAISDRTSLRNVPEYFAALQAVFDTVKGSAWRDEYEIDEEKLRRDLKNYLHDNDWDKLVGFFKPYSEQLLESFKSLKEAFGDGRLIKSIEDVTLAALLKGYVDYDFVVGNPPYVKVGIIDENARKLYRQTFKSVKGKFDIYVPFIERGILWLNEGGTLGYITSNKFIQANYGESIRKIIKNRCQIQQFIDFGDTGVFKDATNYPCIFTLKSSQERHTSFKCIKVNRPKKNITTHIKSNLDKTYYLDEYIEAFDLSQEDLDEYDWMLVPESQIRLLRKIDRRKSWTLGEITTEICKGIWTGSQDIFADNLTKDFIQKMAFEEEIIYPVIRGRNVNRWMVDWTGIKRKIDTYIIYPYKVTKEGIVLVDLDNYPNIKEYMNPHKTQLEKRKNWGETIVQAGKKWYEIWNPSPNMFKVKFITPDISTKNTFVLDENKEYICLDTCYALILKNSYSNLSKFILGLLNSSTLEFYFKHISPFVSGGYYRYKTQYLEKLPIKLPQTKKEEKLVSKITDKVNLILEKVNLEQKIEKFPQEYNKEYREQGVEFDSINITFNSDHKEIKIAVEKSLEGEFNLILGKKERPITVESEAKVEYIKEALEGKKAKKNEKLQFLIPRDDSIVNKILAKLKEDKKATQNPSVSELEEEINKLVYELYGLNKDDRKVIEEFLERF